MYGGRMSRFLIVMSLLSCSTSDKSIMVVNTQPEATIQSPVDGAEFIQYTPINFMGYVDDAQEEPDALQIFWSSDLDGELSTEPATYEGTAYFSTSDLSAGLHTISLLVIDERATEGEDSISLTIVSAVNEPTLTIRYPVEDETGVENEETHFEALVEDEQDELEDLFVTVSSDLNGEICSGNADSSGIFVCDEMLDIGEHILTFSVVDTSENLVVQERVHTVLALTQIDDDEDGFTEEEGDCDDTNSSIFPGAEEFPNEIDDNCNDIIDDGTISYDDDGDCICEGEPCVGSISSDCLELLSGDCDDADASLSPNQTEICDGLDNNCNLIVDEQTDCFDDDNDGMNEQEGDCNDNDPYTYAFATEIIDGIDNDCDGTADEETTAFDDDGDCACETFFSGACTGSIDSSCTTLSQGDCDDTESQVYPLSLEYCDGLDNDCNGQTDESTATDASTWYEDTDGDGYGNSTVSAQACFNPPSGFVSDNTDCDDTLSTINPTTIWYEDSDGDGFGSLISSQQCAAPSTTHILVSGDCNDTASNAYPGATEYCDGVDNNCDGNTDENTALDALLWYQDSDGDGYAGSATTVDSCTQPSGYYASISDCNDGNSSIHPGMTETCDGIDNNCNSSIDENVTNTYYLDNDGDGYGYALSTTQACSVPSGYVSDTSDCDDNSAVVNPSASEVCDGVDNDCDGYSDDGDSSLDSSTTTTWYLDADGDGYGATSYVNRCVQPSGYVTNSTDCNDGSNQAYPNKTESCDGIDNDCDGSTDEANASGCTTYYRDYDGDGFGDASQSQCTCSAQGYFDVTDSSDCYDNNADARPNQTSYFTSNRGDGNYDYDCNGSQDKKWTSTGSCSSLTLGGCDRANTGWSGSVPSCGSSKGFIDDDDDCSWEWSGWFSGSCDRDPGGTRTQKCRQRRPSISNFAVL